MVVLLTYAATLDVVMAKGKFISVQIMSSVWDPHIKPLVMKH